MARNKSEKIPYPELPADAHLYYNTRWGTAEGNSQAVWRDMDQLTKDRLDGEWGSAMHQELVAFYTEKRVAQRK